MWPDGVGGVRVPEVRAGARFNAVKDTDKWCLLSFLCTLHAQLAEYVKGLKDILEEKQAKLTGLLS